MGGGRGARRTRGRGRRRRRRGRGRGREREPRHAASHPPHGAGTRAPRASGVARYTGGGVTAGTALSGGVTCLGGAPSNWPCTGTVTFAAFGRGHHRGHRTRPVPPRILYVTWKMVVMSLRFLNVLYLIRNSDTLRTRTARSCSSGWAHSRRRIFFSCSIHMLLYVTSFLGSKNGRGLH